MAKGKKKSGAPKAGGMKVGAAGGKKMISPGGKSGSQNNGKETGS